MSHFILTSLKIPALDVLCDVMVSWVIVKHKVVKVLQRQQEEVKGAVYLKHVAEQVFQC